MRPLRILSIFYLLLVLVLPLFLLLIHFPPKGWDLNLLESKPLRNSLLMASMVTVLSSGLGGLTAFLLAKTDLRYPYLWAFFLIGPIFFVPYQMALAWSALLPPGKWLQILFSPVGVIWVLTGCFFPVTFWFSWTALRTIPPEEEEAGLVFAPAAKVVKHIALPKLYPALLAGALLVFFLAITELGVPTYLGVPVLPYEVLIEFSSLYDFAAAARTSWPMVGLGFFLLLLEYRFLRKGLVFHQKVSGRRGLVFALSPGRRLLAYSFLIMVILFTLILPLAALWEEALKPQALVFAIENGLPSLGRALVYALVAGLTAALWALIDLYVRMGRGSSLVSGISLAGFFLPPAVVAIGLIFFWGKGPLSVIYGSFLLLIFGYLARYSFLAYRALETAFEQLDLSPWEAAQLTGASNPAILRRIVFPLIRPWFFLGVLLVFVFSMNDLSLGTMLYPPEGEPLVVRLYTLSVNNPLEYSAALALLNSLGVLLGVVGLWRWGWR